MRPAAWHCSRLPNVQTLRITPRRAYCNPNSISLPEKATQFMTCAISAGDVGSHCSPPYLRARYTRPADESHNMRSPSTSTGTWPRGLSLRNAGCLLLATRKIDYMISSCGTFSSASITRNL